VRVAAFLVLAACGGDPDTKPVDASFDSDPTAPDARPDLIIEETQSLMPGELVEGIMTGGPPASAYIHLEAVSPHVGWNIHGHANGGTQVVHEEFDQMTADYPFTPGTASKWYLLVRNDGAVTMDIKVKVQLFGPFTWEWQ